MIRRNPRRRSRSWVGTVAALHDEVDSMMNQVYGLYLDTVQQDVKTGSRISDELVLVYEYLGKAAGALNRSRFLLQRG